MFLKCSSLISLPDISKWNINNVTNMSQMFYKCTLLISLPDISKWNNTNNKNLMFSDFFLIKSSNDIVYLEENEADQEELDDCFEDYLDENNDLEDKLESSKEELKEKTFVKKQENNNANNYEKKEDEKELAMYLNENFEAPKTEPKKVEKKI